jgi:hypothetical protein
MTDVTTTIDHYFAMWNEADPDARAREIEEAWAAGGRYVDPLLEATGHAELSAMVEGVHAQFPGHKFRRTSGIDMHHEEVRFAWELAAPDGTLTVAGLDVGSLTADGRLRRISGFFGDLPTA